MATYLRGLVCKPSCVCGEYVIQKEGGRSKSEQTLLTCQNLDNELVWDGGTRNYVFTWWVVSIQKLFWLMPGFHLKRKNAGYCSALMEG